MLNHAVEEFKKLPAAQSDIVSATLSLRGLCIAPSCLVSIIGNRAIVQKGIDASSVTR